jgi:hypothetical protein
MNNSKPRILLSPKKSKTLHKSFFWEGNWKGKCIKTKLHNVN